MGAARRSRPAGVNQEEGLRIVSGAGAACLLDPLRQRLLRALAEGPDSAAGLARRTGLARQRLGYHLRALESHGLVEVVEERRRGNCTERIVRASARAYLIDPGALGGIGPAGAAAARDRFSGAYQVAALASSIGEVAEVRRRADRAGKKVATFTLQCEVRFASAASQGAFAEELSNTVAALVARYHDERSAEGRSFRFIAAVHPAITAPGAGAAEEDAR